MNSCAITAVMNQTEFRQIFNNYPHINDLIETSPWGNMVSKAFIFHKQRDYLSSLIFGTLAIWMYKIETTRGGGDTNPEIIQPLIQLIENSRLSYQKDLKSETEDGKDDESVEFKPEKPSELKLDFDTLIGMQLEKTFINQKFIYPNQYPYLFLTERNNVLLYGPPGTGKTELAKATAKEISTKYPEFKIFFVVATAADLRSKWEGGTEKRIKSLFTYAKELADKYLKGEFVNSNDETLRGGPLPKAKVIIFLDEVESLASDREKDPQNSRAVTTLLQEMQGFKDGDMDNVMVLGATNFPWSLDPAFLRRFSGKLMVTLPGYTSRVKLVLNKLLQKYEKEKRFMRKRLVNLRFISHEEQVRGDIDYYRSLETVSRLNPADQIKLRELEESLQRVQDSGFVKYSRAFKGGRTLVKDFLGIYANESNIKLNLATELSNADEENKKKIQNEIDIIDSSYQQITNENLLPIVQNELSFLNPSHLNPRSQTEANQHWNEESYEEYLVLYNTFMTSLSSNRLNTDMNEILQSYIESFIRYNFGIYFVDCDIKLDNLYELAIYIHYLGDIIGPSPLAKLYYLNNLSHDKTSVYANSFFGYSNSDISNLVNEFFGIMASNIISSNFEEVDENICQNICESCNINTAQYLDEVSVPICTKCWKKSLADGALIASYTQISSLPGSAHQGNPETDMFQGVIENTDMYVLFKETDFKLALDRFKTTTGNDPKMCDWWFYAQENEAPSGQSKKCQTLMNSIWTKIRLQEMF
jgi:SpoVK/Ycf46/Vps4 family AAA+-type ATPase